MNTSQKDCMYCGDPGTPTVPDKDKEILNWHLNNHGVKKEQESIMTTEQILSHIREVCGLKRLEFGCEVKHINTNAKIVCIKHSENEEERNYIEKDGSIMHNFNSFLEYPGNYQIIGLPVHLEHLIHLIRGKVSATLHTEGLLIEHNQYCTFYDTTKSVEQNLTDNTELRELIISLIK